MDWNVYEQIKRKIKKKEGKMEQTLKLEDLRESKIYVRNNISYMKPKELVNPFLNKIGYDESTDQLHIEVQNAVVNQNVEGGENIAYPRFMLEVRREEVFFGDVAYVNVFGLLIGMDQQKPIIKAYTGMNVSACTNLCVFNADETYSQNLMESLDNTWNAVVRFSENEKRKLDNYREIHMNLVDTSLNQEEVNERLGFLLRNANKTKLGTTPIVNAAKLLTDRASAYYFEKETNMFNLFNAVTQGITDSKDLLYRPDKTWGLAKLLLN